MWTRPQGTNPGHAVQGIGEGGLLAGLLCNHETRAAGAGLEAPGGSPPGPAPRADPMVLS